MHYDGDKLTDYELDRSTSNTVPYRVMVRNETKRYDMI